MSTASAGTGSANGMSVHAWQNLKAFDVIATNCKAVLDVVALKLLAQEDEACALFMLRAGFQPRSLSCKSLHGKCMQRR